MPENQVYSNQLLECIMGPWLSFWRIFWLRCPWSSRLALCTPRAAQTQWALLLLLLITGLLRLGQCLPHRLFIHVIITAYLSWVFRKCSLWIILARLSNSFSLTLLLKNIKHDGLRFDVWRVRLWLLVSLIFCFSFLTCKIILLWGYGYCFWHKCQEALSKVFYFHLMGGPHSGQE